MMLDLIALALLVPPTLELSSRSASCKIRGDLGQTRLESARIVAEITGVKTTLEQ